MNELTVAFAGVVAGGVVGVTAPVMTWLVALGNRRADRRPANAVNDPTPLQPER